MGIAVSVVEVMCKAIANAALCNWQTTRNMKSMLKSGKKRRHFSSLVKWIHDYPEARVAEQFDAAIVKFRPRSLSTISISFAIIVSGFLITSFTRTTMQLELKGYANKSAPVYNIKNLHVINALFSSKLSVLNLYFDMDSFE